MSELTYEKRIQDLINECEELTVSVDPKAPEKLNTLINIASSLEDYSLLGKAEFLFANWYYDQSMLEDFQRSLKNAIEHLFLSKDNRLLSRCYSLFAVDAQDSNAYDVAYTYFLSALQFIDEEENPREAGIVTTNLARLHYDIGNYKLAAQYYEKGKGLVEKNADDPFYQRNMLLANINTGNNSIAMEDYETAETAYHNAGKLLADDEVLRASDIALLFNFLEASLLLVKGDREKSFDITRSTIATIKEDNKLGYFIYDLMDIFMHLMRANEYEMIAEILDTVHEPLLEEGSVLVKRLLYEMEVDYYDAIKDDIKLYETLREQQRLMPALKEEKLKVYRNSINLISLLENMNRSAR